MTITQTEVYIPAAEQAKEECLRLPQTTFEPFHKISIEITSHCNFNCIFCPNSKMKRKRGMMSGEMFRSIIDEIAKHHLTELISFHIMGEPLLHPDFFEFLEYAHEKGQRLHLISNISLINETNLKAILKNVEILELSLHSFDTLSFAQRGSRKMDFGQYVKLVKRIIEMKFVLGSLTKIKLSMIESSVNFLKNTPKEIRLLDSSEKLKEFLNHYWERFFQETAARFAVPYTRPGSVKYRGFTHEFLPGVFMETRWYTTWGNTMAASKSVIPAWSGKCDGLRKQLGILWNGDVVPCCGDFEGNIVLGNCGKTGLAGILQSEYSRKMRAGFKKGKLINSNCRRCKGGTSLLSWAANQAFSFYKYRHI
jgi:radical SAM protein with 4Fe4S-binding SPASM domain